MGVLNREPHPPLGLLYLASSLRMKGHTPYFHIWRESEIYDSIVEEIRRKEIDVCCLSLYTSQILLQFRLMEKLKEQIPITKIVIGGPHASALSKITMEECPYIDYLVFGEGEETICKLIEAISINKAVDDIKGICFRKGDQVITTIPRPLIMDMDTIPFPAYDLFLPYRGTYASIITSRGCLHNCEFCYKGVFGSTFRRRSPENVVEELKILVNDYGFKHIYFADDYFDMDSNWLEEFYEGIESHNIKFTWSCMGDIMIANEYRYRRMKEHGCIQICFGIESGNEEILKGIGKNITKEDIKNAIRAARKAGIITRGFYILGHRMETEHSLKDTIAFALQERVTSGIFYIMSPFPGSMAYQYVREGLKYRWDLYCSQQKIGYRGISICSISPDTLWNYWRKAVARFYGNISYLWDILFHIDISRRERKEAIKFWLFGVIARFTHIKIKRLYDF